MKTRIFSVFLLLSAGLAAQSSSGYIFGGAGAVPCCGTAVSMLHFGGGVDGILGRGLGIALEGGVLGPAQDLSASVLTFSPGLSYHFGRGENNRLDPFVAGGYTMLVRNGILNTAHFGGGANYWFGRRVGLRLEFRDILYTGGGASVHYLGFRAGVAIR